MSKLQPAGPEILDKWFFRTELSAVIDAPVSEVWNVVSDGSRWASWYRLKEAEVIGGGELALGAELYERDWAYRTTHEVVEWIPERRIGTTLLTFPIPGLLRRYYRELELTPEGSGTNVTLRAGYRPGVFGWLLIPYTAAQLPVSAYLEFSAALKGLAEQFDDA